MVEILPFSRYRNVYDASRKESPATDTLQPLEEISGQERALRALSFGLEIREAGFNVYVAGIAGTGRKTAVMDFLERLAKTKPKAGD